METKADLYRLYTLFSRQPFDKKVTFLRNGGSLFNRFLRVWKAERKQERASRPVISRRLEQQLFKY
ncbi:MAG: hypothetical protein EA344_09100 [Alkalicoccus sp.]|nr:MAG: hypothetical protein EA344_09100 [Alkalicoccus sp.]